MKRVLFYCQHVLGMGHLMRSMALVEGMMGNFQVCFLNGGELIPGFDFPDEVDVVNLPPMKSDENFTGITGVGSQSVEEVKAARSALVLETYANFHPDILVIELFPFGRKKFAFELLPLLARIRTNGDATKVACSLRDIMVQRRDQFRHEDRACRILNRYFDQILVHADASFHRLEESFFQTERLEVPVVYTGYVAQSSSASCTVEALDLPTAWTPRTPLLLASIGGGRVGVELLATTIDASIQLVGSMPHHLLIFTGPYLPDDDFHRLESMVAEQPHIDLRRYTNRFLAYMQAADLSISMAGYNTSMNVLKTGIRAIMLPFGGGNNDEQLIRCQKLKARGLARLILPDELLATNLAELIQEELQQEASPMTLDLNGVSNSNGVLQTLTETSGAADSAAMSSFHTHKQAMRDSAALERLRAFLDKWSEEQCDPTDKVDIFLRDDDIDVDEDTLRQLLDIALARDVPVNLEVIPANLTDDGYRLVADHKRFTPHLVELNQHGWQHLNHESVGRKCEFGLSRSYAQQYDDIAKGKAILAETFDDLFSPVFTPPWNRCTEDTYRIVDELGFSVFSGLRNGHPIEPYNFQELSVTLDIFRWKGGATLKPVEAIVAELIEQMDLPHQERHPIGLMLHHKVMDIEAFGLVDQLLCELQRYPQIHFHTFQSLAKKMTRTR